MPDLRTARRVAADYLYPGDDRTTFHVALKRRDFASLISERDVELGLAALEGVAMAELEVLAPIEESGFDPSTSTWEAGWRAGYGQAMVALRNFFVANGIKV